MKKFLFLLLFLPVVLFAQTKQVIPVGKNADSIVSINNIYTGIGTPILRWRSPIAKYSGSWMWFDAKNFKYDSVSTRTDGLITGKALWIDPNGVLKFSNLVDTNQLGYKWASYDGLGTTITGGCFYNGLFYFPNTLSGQGIATSPDGKLMTYQTTPTGNTTIWYDVFGTNGTLIAVGKSGTYNVMRSTDNGTTWSYITGSTSATNGKSWRRVTSDGNGNWVACAFEGAGTDNIMTSHDDGLTWTRKTIPVSTDVTDVWYGDGYFFATRYDATGGVFRSTDLGDTWTALTIPAAVVNTIAGQYGNGVCYVISQDGGSNTCARSLDRGDTWEIMPTINTTDQFLDIEYGNGVTVIVNRGTVMLYSVNDGATWNESRSFDPLIAALKCIYGNGIFSVRDTYSQRSIIAGATIDNLLPEVPTGGGTVTSVSGTTNRITSTGGITPVIDISSSYVGQNSIQTLGNITSGSWTSSTKIGIAYGGTNADLSATGGTGQVLKQSTVGGNVTVGLVSATELTGILPINNGGTGEGALTQWDFTDGTKKLKGNNITMQYYSEQAYWGFFYQNWSADSNFFHKYVAPQIDWSKANGCNAVRMIGSVAGIVNGTYTLAQYNAMQVQIIRYLQSKRMYYYPCFGSMGDGLTYSQFTDSTSTGYVGRCVSVSQTFTQYTNVIGIDMCNEILFTTGGFTSNQQINFIAILSRNIRALYPTLKLSASITSSTEGITSSFDKGNSNIVNISTYFDFIDRHMYTTNTYEAPDNLSFYSKPIIMGEYGATSSLSTRMLSMPPLLAANGVNGGFFFCQNSYDNLAVNQYGLYDPNYIPLDPLAAIYFATLIPNQGYQKKLTKVFCASFYDNVGTPLSSYVPDLNTPVTLGAITGSPVINSINQLNMPLSSNFRISNVANGDMVRSQIITLVALSEIRYQFHNSSNVVQFTCRVTTNAGNTQVTMDISNAAGTIIATSAAITTSFASVFEMWYDGTTIRMRNGLTNVGISASAPSLSVNRMFLVNNAGGSAVIKQLAVFRP